MDNNWLDFKDKIINEQVKAVFSYRDLNIINVNKFVSIELQRISPSPTLFPRNLSEVFLQNFDCQRT